MRMLPLALASLIVSALVFEGSVRESAFASETSQKTERRTSRIGELTPDDQSLPDGQVYDVWNFQAEMGQNLNISIESEDFQPLVLVEGIDDKGETEVFVPPVDPDNVDVSAFSHIRMSFSDAEDFKVVVMGFKGQEDTLTEPHQGSYEITIVEEGPLTLMPDLDGSLIGKGRLEESDRFQAGAGIFDEWVFTGIAEQEIEITVESPDFDTSLELGYIQEDGSYAHSYSNDDASSSTTNSSMSRKILGGGEFRVFVFSPSAGATGDYTLRVRGTSPSSAEDKIAAYAARAARDRAVFNEAVNSIYRSSVMDLNTVLMYGF